MTKAIQDIAEPEGVCFGCGPANAQGLRIKSRPDPDGVHMTAVITPDAKYCGWPNLVYGGYLAMLVDCHSNWTAMAAHYRAEGREPGSLPKINCATRQLTVNYLRPTPMGVPLRLRARVEGEVGKDTRIICEIYASNILTAKGDSVFTRVNAEALARSAQKKAARSG